MSHPASGSYDGRVRVGIWPIRVWLGSLVVAVGLPLVLILTSMFLWQLERELEEARDQARRVATTTAARLRAQQESAGALLARVAQRPAVREFDGLTCDSMFAIASSLPNALDLLFFDAEGALVCSASLEKRNELLAGELRPWITGEIAASAIPHRRPVVRQLHGRWIAILAEPVVHESGALRGTLVLVQGLDFAAGDALVPKMVVTILDRDANVIVRTSSRPPMLGSNVYGWDIATVAMREHEGSTQATEADGISRQYGFTFLPQPGWTIIASVRTAEVMRRVRSMFQVGAGGGAAVILLIAVLATAITRGIERPVSNLVSATEMVAQTGYGHAEAQDGPREIVRLSAAFNEMVEHRSQREGELKALSDRLLLVQEQERARVARELHDDLGQSLTALKMDVIGLIDKCGQAPDTATMAGRILKTIDATVTSVQRISSELRPSVLDEFGLFAAIESETQLFEQRTGIECDLSLPDDPGDFEEAVLVAVYRMFQEAMTNVARHSNASRVEIRVRRLAAELLLEIRDDGRGITSEGSVARPALGLQGIRERAALVGGTAIIEGGADRGTVVSIRIPVPQREENEA